MSQNRPFKVVHLVELLNKKFRIPDYQRGYRWDRKQVFDLLDDLKEFNQQKKDEGFYCLQPLVVVDSGLRDDGTIVYDIIDGQQRLTTIYLLLTYLENERASNCPDSADPRHSSLYDLSFQSRDAEFLAEKKFRQVSEENALDENIDYFYMVCAYKAIDEWFSKENYSKPDIAKLLLPSAEEYIIDDELSEEQIEEANGKVRDVRFLWYDVTESEGFDESIKIFRRINYGKTQLTSTELIKALLFQTDKSYSPDYQAVCIGRAHEWDEYEKMLQNELVWGMLTANSDDSASHMKLLLDYVCQELVNKNPDLFLEINLKDKDANYRIVNRFLESLNDSERKNSKIKKGKDLIEFKCLCRERKVKELWDNIQSTYTTFINWYKNNVWYHYIGLIVTLCKRKYKESFDYASKLREIYNEYTKRTKDSFQNYLKQEIGKLIKIDPNKQLEKINYEDDPKDIVAILIAFNVYLTISSSREDNRFNFNLFNEKDVTSLEHIHPQHLDEDDLTLVQVTSWYDTRENELRKAMLQKFNEEEISETLKQFESFLTDEKTFQRNLDQVHEMLRTFDEYFDDLAGMKENEMHTLYNMALVTVNDNSALSNNKISRKREILETREKNNETYALIGTRYAYSKYFTQSDDTTMPSLWMKEDRTAYFNKIKEVYDYFVACDCK